MKSEKQEKYEYDKKNFSILMNNEDLQRACAYSLQCKK